MKIVGLPGHKGNAKIEGMLDSLHMTDKKYNVALSLFFVPYILFGKYNDCCKPRIPDFLVEVPANSILDQYFRSTPSWWIAGLTVAWGK
jgi:hypothetical protein